MKTTALVFSLLALAACGADGPPKPRDTGASVSGEVKIGVVGSL